MPLVQTVLAALVGAAAFEALKVPAGALIGALVATAALNLITDGGAVELPSSLRFAAFALLGWAVGQGVTTETVRTVRASLVPIVLTVAALVYTVLAWKDRLWGLTGRVHYTLVTVAAVAFVWFLNYWNLLGWRF